MSTAIPAKEPHVVAATTEKIFNSLWIRNFSVRSYGVDAESSIYIEVVPYNPETGEIDHGNPREIRAALWPLVNHDYDNGPNPAAIAMGAIFAAIPWIEGYIEETEIVPEPTPEPEPEEEPQPEE